ncbi:MGMT family protein [Chlamydiifrater volucris]|uniref:MGMT family protein n=1 Tax=Chlamydiifrater volucris TaxID=2681470 RepID=UPI0032B2C632
MFSSPSELELVSKQTKKTLFQACSQGLVLSAHPPLRVMVRFDSHIPMRSFLTRSPVFACLFLGSSAHQPMVQTVDWLINYSCKKSQELPKCFEKIPLSLPQKTVFKLIANIPFGDSLPSREIASNVGISVDEVDVICNTNPLPLFIPCHRVHRQSYPEPIKNFYSNLQTFEKTGNLVNP